MSAPATPRSKGGRPKGRKNSIRYREGVARSVLRLRIPHDAGFELRAVGEEARAIVERAVRSTDPLAFCKPHVMAAIYLLRYEIAKPASILDLLSDLEKPGS